MTKEVTMEIKQKIFLFKVADIDAKQRIVKAYFASFGNIDNDGDVIQRGALTKTIMENGPKGKNIIRHFLNHEFRKSDAALPIGKILELGEDEFGGYFVSKIGRTEQANDVYTLYEDGIINSHSFGFIPVKTVKTQTSNIITEARMFEVSTVTTWAANDNTPTVFVKSADEAGIIPTSHKALFIEPSRSTLAEEAAMKEITKLFLQSNIFKKL